MINLTGRTALITGGSRGIGAACTEYFVKAGADVAFTYKNNSDSARKLVTELGKLAKVKAFKVDVESEKEVKVCVDEVAEEFGAIDILVNNAGIWLRAPVDGMSFIEWRETLGVNLTGAFLFTKYTVPFMKKKRYGRIINISSTAGQRGEAFYSHYAASKGGMIAFTKSLASELGEFNITVNSVAPGWVVSDMTRHIFDDPEERRKELSIIPLGRVALPEDIAGPVIFLASELARHITGAILNVIGGSVLCG